MATLNILNVQVIPLKDFNQAIQPPLNMVK